MISDGTSKVVPVPKEGEIEIGKDPSCALVLADDQVSRRHALLRSQGGFFVLEDLQSTNGTLVNGEEIHTHFLNAGDEITVGGVSLRLQKVGAASASSQKPKVASPGAAGDPTQMMDVLTGLLAGGETEQGVAERMLDGLLTAFDAERGVVFLPAKGGEFTTLARRSRAGSDAWAEPISQTLICQVAKEKTPKLLTSLETEELKQVIGSIAATVRSILAAPINLAGSKPGVVYLDSGLERRKFEVGAEERLMSFAKAAEQALKVRRQKERMAEIQRREVLSQDLLGDSPAMKGILGEIAKAASTDVSVLVVGETGTGKELVARALHRGSDRAGGPFVAVNCAAIPSELVESELFGHEKGAFSGANERRLGRFELADGGTLFLDEVGELPLQAQGKLLRALQERVIERVGGGSPIPVNFRLVSATNVEMGLAVKEGKFREDLYYRVAVFPLNLPPLRDRGEDTCLIAETFLKRFAQEFRRPISGMDDSARKALMAYPWPGNIRELRNVIEQAVVRCDGNVLNAQALAPAMGMRSFSGAPTGEQEGASASGGGMEIYPGRFDEARKQFEKEFIIFKLTEMRGNIKATSESIGLTRRALYLKCTEYEIDYTTFR